MPLSPAIGLSSYLFEAVHTRSILCKMQVIYTSIIFAIFAVRLAVASGVQCEQPRSASDPAGASAAGLLTNGIEAVASEHLADGAIIDHTFVHELGSVICKITRQDGSAQPNDPRAPFYGIVAECVERNNFWGGIVTASGWTYQIYGSATGKIPTHGIERRAKSKSKPRTKTTKKADSPKTIKANMPNPPKPTKPVTPPPPRRRKL